MLNSTESTGSTNGSPPDFNQQLSPADNGSLPIEFPLTPQGSSAPTEGQNSPPPESSTATPPPDGPSSTSSPPPPDSTSSPPSPPSDSNSSSPPSDSGPSPPAPPPDSNSSVPSPPSGSDSSPPPLPQDSSSSSPPPLASPAPDSPASHPPPTVPGQSSSPPSITPPSSANSPPPPNSPPAESVPAPVASNGPAPPLAGNSGSPTPPPVQTASPTLPESPPIAVPSPQVPGSPSEPSTNNPTPSNEVPPSTLTPPTSRSPQFPKLSPPSTSSDSNSSSTSSKSSGSSGGGPVIGVTLAGVVVIALVALFFIVVRRRKKQAEAFAARYKPTPNSFSGQLDGYYHSQQHTHQLTIGGSGRSDLYFGTKPPSSPSAFGNGYGSHRGFSSGAPESSVMGAKSWFSYEELMEVTNGFSQQNILGEGGFGCVYKGWLPDGRVVAVKQLKAGSGQGEREFRAEVEIISRVHHRHLVSLVGYCIAEHHRLLVYEFVPNNTLEHHLHGKGMPVMDWAKRVKISVGAARGLAYLHEDCHPKIIHRDIKSANILLDDAFEAQVADFGLAKLSNDTHTHVSTRVMGTFGYMAPEYASSGKLTDRSDVFSFGVVLLELLTGRKPVDPTQPLGDESLVEWARPHLIHALETGDFEELVDPKLEKRYVESEMFRMIETAAACVRHSAPKRPRMVQVARSLDSEGDMPDLTNGVKFGQSTVFESRQSSSDIQRFRRMAFGSNDGSEYGMYSGENNSGEVPCRPPISWRPRDGSSEFSSGDLETQALNRRASERSFNEAHTNIGSRRFI